MASGHSLQRSSLPLWQEPAVFTSEAPVGYFLVEGTPAYVYQQASLWLPQKFRHLSRFDVHAIALHARALSFDRLVLEVTEDDVPPPDDPQHVLSFAKGGTIIRAIYANAPSGEEARLLRLNTLARQADASQIHVTEKGNPPLQSEAKVLSLKKAEGLKKAFKAAAHEGCTCGRCSKCLGGAHNHHHDHDHDHHHDHPSEKAGGLKKAFKAAAHEGCTCGKCSKCLGGHAHHHHHHHPSP